MKDKILTILDRSICRALLFALCRFFRKKRQSEIGNIRRILVVGLGGAGDALLTVPFLKRLRLHYPSASLEVLCIKEKNPALGLVNSEAGINRIHYLPRSLPRLIFGQKYDIIFDLYQSRFFNIVGCIISVLPRNIVIGYSIPGRKSCHHTFEVPYRVEDYEALSILKLLGPFSLDTELKPEDLAFKGISNSPKIDGKKKVALAAGALKEERRIPIERFAEIIEDNKGRAVFYLFGAGERDNQLYDKLTTMLPTECEVYRRDNLSFGQAVEALRSLDCFIGGNVGGMHMAVIAGIPTLTFWNWSNILEKWVPPFGNHLGIRVKQKCKACLRNNYQDQVFVDRRPDCRCMSNFTTEEMLLAVREFLKLI